MSLYLENGAARSSTLRQPSGGSDRVKVRRLFGKRMPPHLAERSNVNLQSSTELAQGRSWTPYRTRRASVTSRNAARSSSISAQLKSHSRTSEHSGAPSARNSIFMLTQHDSGRRQQPSSAPGP